MQARAADLVLVDEGDPKAELGGAEGGGIATGAGAEDDEIEVVGGSDGHGQRVSGVTSTGPARGRVIASMVRAASRAAQPRGVARWPIRRPRSHERRVLDSRPRPAGLTKGPGTDPERLDGPSARAPDHRADAGVVPGGLDPGRGDRGSLRARDGPADGGLRADGRDQCAAGPGSQVGRGRGRRAISSRGHSPWSWHGSSPTTPRSRCCAAPRRSPGRSGPCSPGSGSGAAWGRPSGRCW